MFGPLDQLSVEVAIGVQAASQIYPLATTRVAESAARFLQEHNAGRMVPFEAVSVPKTSSDGVTQPVCTRG